MNAHAATLGTLDQGSVAAWVMIPSDALQTDVLTIFAISDEFAGSVETRYWVSNGGAFGTGTLAYGGRGGANNASFNSGATNLLLDGEWHHVAVTHATGDATTRLYIDGLEVATAAGAFFSNVTGANSASVGRNKDSAAGGGQWFFDGSMDDFAIWNRPLNAAEVASLHSEGLAGNPIGGVSAAGLEITGVSRASDGTVAVTWRSMAGKTYFLDFTTDLETAGWEEIDDTTATGPTTTLEDDFANAGEANGFYRVREE